MNLNGAPAPSNRTRAVNTVSARVRSWAPAMMSASASVIVTVASLVIARYDGFGSFGMFVALQAVGVILGIPMLWGLHVNASRAMATRSDIGAVAGTALIMVAAASGVTSAGYLALLGLARGVAPLVAPAELWHAAGLGASAAMICLAESMLRIQGRQLLASGLRLASAVGYLLALAAVLGSGHGGAVAYATLVTGSNAVCALLMLIGLRRTPENPAAGGGDPGNRTPCWDAGLARTLLRQGWTYSTGQSLLILLFGFDVILLMQASGPAAVAVYALYVGSCRRLIGVLFTDSLASMLIASLSRQRASTGGRMALRYGPRLFGLALVGASVVVLAGLAAADAMQHLVAGWVALTAIGSSAHALVTVLFCVFTVQPALGLARIRAVLAAAFLPGLALQGAGAAFGGVPGMIAAFTALNVALAWWFIAVIRRPVASSGK